MDFRAAFAPSQEEEEKPDYRSAFAPAESIPLSDVPGMAMRNAPGSLAQTVIGGIQSMLNPVNVGRELGQAV